jgi:hypothetical protein
MTDLLFLLTFMPYYMLTLKSALMGAYMHLLLLLPLDSPEYTRGHALEGYPRRAASRVFPPPAPAAPKGGKEAPGPSLRAAPAPPSSLSP